MTVNQIECFEAVAQTMSFSKAAGTLYVSQPAISKSISHLEDEIGYKLFERENNILTLTRAGELFRDFVERSRIEYQTFLDQLEMLKVQASATIRVGCPDSWNPNHFASWMEKCYNRVFPDGRLTIEAYKLSDLLLRLNSGKLDFVISHDFYSPSIPGLRAERISETGMGILYARGMFAEPVQFTDLAKKGFVVFDDDIRKRFGALIQSVCRKEGCETQIRNGGSITKCLFELSRGNAVMLFTDWDNFVTNQAFGYYRVGGTLPVRLIYYTDRIKSVGHAFIKELKKARKENTLYEINSYIQREDQL